jgi:hypothetical protein
VVALVVEAGEVHLGGAVDVLLALERAAFGASGAAFFEGQGWPVRAGLHAGARALLMAAMLSSISA